MADVRLALVGAGPWGLNIAHTVAAMKGVELAVVASRNPETAGRLAPGVRVVRDWRDAIDVDVDGVVIASPPASHAEIALAAIEKGRAVLIEKPLTMNVAEAERVLEAAARADVTAAVDHVHLFHPAFRELIRRARDLGAVRAVEAVAGGHGPFRADTPVLWDWGPHDIAMCLDLMGRRPARAEASVRERRRTPDGTGETVDIALEFEQGIVANIAVGNVLSDKIRRFRVAFDGGSLIYRDHADAALAFVDKEGREHSIDVSPVPPLTCVLADLAGKIAAGGRDRTGLALGVDVVRVLADCDAAINAGA